MEQKELEAFISEQFKQLSSEGVDLVEAVVRSSIDVAAAKVALEAWPGKCADRAANVIMATRQ